MMRIMAGLLAVLFVMLATVRLSGDAVGLAVGLLFGLLVGPAAALLLRAVRSDEPAQPVAPVVVASPSPARAALVADAWQEDEDEFWEICDEFARTRAAASPATPAVQVTIHNHYHAHLYNAHPDQMRGMTTRRDA